MTVDPESGLKCTGFFNLALPARPPPKAILIYEQDLKDGRARIEYRPDARLHLAVHDTRPGSSDSLEVTSCPVTNPTGSHCIIGFTWSLTEPRGMGLIVEGELVAIAAQNVPIPASYIVPAKQFSGTPIDYSESNAIALSKRKHRLDGFNPIKGREKGDKAYLFGQLDAEFMQIRDLSLAIRNGQHHHAFGLAARLRLLMAAGKSPMPLLQLCAATIGEPLVVYAPPMPLYVPVMDLLGPSSYGLSCDISPKPTGRLNNPIDIDAWLDLTALSITATNVSHRRMLTVIGDTVGSHVDQYLHPHVQIWRSIKAEMRVNNGDQMIEYLLKISDSAVVLCQHLLMKR
jgi:hypothetical protein